MYPLRAPSPSRSVSVLRLAISTRLYRPKIMFSPMAALEGNHLRLLDALSTHEGPSSSSLRAFTAAAKIKSAD